MKYETRRKIRNIDKKLDILLALVAALVDEGSDRTAAKALAADVIKNTAALQSAASAIPAPAGTSTP